MDPNLDRYSSHVQLRLEANGQVVSLAQVAPDWVIPAEAMDVPAGDVNIVVQVNGVDDARRMYLPNGKSARGVKVRISAARGEVQL